MKTNIILLALLLLFFFQDSISQQVILKETTKNMKTYSFSDPDPVPKIGRVYPYYRFDGYTDEGQMQNWKFIELENDFIKVSITPEIGGKIWGAYDKASNFPFVYFNNVVKFRDVAMRGAWTSGGIELNFGDIGHDPTVSNPVDYFTRTNLDGSVSCFVGAYDWASRTKWTVELNLPKDKAYFTTKSKWFNAGKLDQSYYHWMNAGFKSTGDLEFLFPGTHYIGHGGELNSWPKTKVGKEINFYEKNNFGTYKSYHVLGKTDDFFGGYWHKNKIGFIHYSPYHEKLGKKIWVWGPSRQGMIWENLLTDTDGQYVELQSGRLFNQAADESINSPFKHVDFKPNTTDSWTEYWYPIKNLDGVTQAAKWGAWTLTQKGFWLHLAISPAESISDTLTIWLGKNKKQKVIQLHPIKTFRDSIQINGVDKTQIFFGSIKLYDSAEEKTIERPLETPKNFDWNTEYAQFMKGKDLSNQRKFDAAEQVFSKLLLKNAYHIPTLGEMAQLHFRKGLYQKAIDYSKKALSVNTYDPLANYLLGLATFQVQNYNAAKDAFSVAVLSPLYRTSSLVELGKLALIENDLEKAETIANQALDADHKNENAQHLKLAILRKKGRTKDAYLLISTLLDENPLDHFARAETYLLSKIEEDKKSFVANFKNELPHENYIEMAIWYKEMHDFQSATAILSIAPQHPMVNLWKSDFTQNFTEAKIALEMSPNLVFPFRHEELGLFERLLKNPDYSKNWVLNYYYGTLLWQLNRKKEAETQYLKCADFPDFYPFYLAKASLFKENKAIVKSSLLKANNLAPKDWRTTKALADFYISEKEYEKALTVNENAKRFSVHEKYILGQQKAEILNLLGKYIECLDFMKKLKMLPNEGAKGMHDLFRKTNIQYSIQLIRSNKKKEAKQYLNEAETWPENLGSGEPYNPDNQLTEALKTYLANENKVALLSIKNKLNKADRALLTEFLMK